MSTISKSLSGFIFNGAALALASAPWKGNVGVIYGFNAGGTGYTSFKPGSNFNSLTQLVQDGVYIVAATTTGFDIPGAVVQAVAPVAASPLSISGFTNGPRNDANSVALVFDIASTDPHDSQAGSYSVSLLDAGTGALLPDASLSTGPHFDPDGVSLAAGQQVRLVVMSPLGHVLFHDFTSI